MKSARDIIDACLVWDNHGCLPLRPHDESFLPQLVRYRAAGVDHISLNIGFGDDSIEKHVRMIASFRHWLAQRAGEYVLVRTVEDIEHARTTGRLAVSFDIEGANAVGDQASLVQLYFDLGVRWMLLAYNRNNSAAGGCLDEDTGLTDFGRRLMDEMHRVGMVVCCSHSGERTARDVMAYAQGPVVFSHSNPTAVRQHPRNISDALMRQCAATGGVVGINGVGPFLGDNDIRSETFVRHLDYAVQLIGPQHVALGLDYVFDQAEIDGGMAEMKHIFPPELGFAGGMNFVRPEQLEEIVEGLMRLGYLEHDLQAILGGNLMRVARQVWKAPR
ncbi:MAG: membrane dipeptidase [Burkholderiales bacterium]|nr:membrane dipeptidase [Burkholderiales bacterium]